MLLVISLVRQLFPIYYTCTVVVPVYSPGYSDAYCVWTDLRSVDRNPSLKNWPLLRMYFIKIRFSLARFIMNSAFSTFYLHCFFSSFILPLNSNFGDDALSDCTLVECRSITGRAHQLRLHLHGHYCQVSDYLAQDLIWDGPYQTRS